MNKFLYFNGSLILTSLSLLFPTHAMDEKLFDEIEILNNTSLTKISVREEDGKTKKYPLNPSGHYTTIKVKSRDTVDALKGEEKIVQKIWLSIPSIAKQLDSDKMESLKEYRMRYRSVSFEPDCPEYKGGWLDYITCRDGAYFLLTHPQNTTQWVLQEDYRNFDGKKQLIGYSLVVHKT
ncbi:MAG: hypothetical protein BGO67_01695 [Alphaproteobacteria bacterium 41-28]|nr:MAG: hypothetical protein BGO67_01695 [Alphaproteobacteria bacterium 41-28]